jgi:hypothetical protein
MKRITKKSEKETVKAMENGDYYFINANDSDALKEFCYNKDKNNIWGINRPPNWMRKDYIKSVKEGTVETLRDLECLRLMINPDKETCLKMIKDYTSAWDILHLHKPAKEVYLKAFKYCKYIIEYIPEKWITKEMKLEAVKSDGSIIRYIKNPTKEMKLEAVKSLGWSIKYIKNPTEEMKSIALKKHIGNIEYIENPSEEIQLEAVQNCGWYIGFIKNPTMKVKKAAMNEDARVIRNINATEGN